MRAHLGNKHRDRFDIKADEGELPISNLLPNIWCCATLMKTEVNALVRQRAYSGTTGAKRIMEEQEAMALTRAYTTLRDDFIIWHYRNCRAMCRRIASPRA